MIIAFPDTNFWPTCARVCSPLSPALVIYERSRAHFRQWYFFMTLDAYDANGRVYICFVEIVNQWVFARCLLTPAMRTRQTFCTMFWMKRSEPDIWSMSSASGYVLLYYSYIIIYLLLEMRSRFYIFLRFVWASHGIYCNIIC